MARYNLTYKIDIDSLKLLPRKITTLFIRLRLATCKTSIQNKTKRQPKMVTGGQYGTINHTLL